VTAFPPSRVSRAPTVQARFALAVSLWGIFVSNVTLTILIIALPSIAKDLNGDLAFSNWVSFAPMLAVAALTPLAGPASDRYGARRLWLMGFALTLFGIGCSSIAPSLGWLIVARFVTGIGTALFVPAALAITTQLYPPELRATPAGYWTTTVAISPLLGVLLGGYLNELLGWRMLFLGQLLLGIPPLIAGSRLPRQAPQAARPFDWEGSAAAAIAAAGLLFAATWLGKDDLLSRPVLGAIAVTLVAGSWLYAAERRAENPVLPPVLLSDPSVQLALCARVAMSFSYMGAFMTLPYLLTSLWGLSESAVSLALSWRPLAMGIAGTFTGRLALRFGASSLTLAGSALLVLATAAFVGLDDHPDYAVLRFGLIVAGVGLGIASPGTVAVVTTKTSPELLGTVSGLMTLTATLANALGMAGLFAVVEAHGGVRSAHAYRVSAAAGTGVALLGLAAALALHRRERASGARQVERLPVDVVDSTRE
jgi:MFS transporter, DHA2 family, methylenomycin A resistance protein